MMKTLYIAFGLLTISLCACSQSSQPKQTPSGSQSSPVQKSDGANLLKTPFNAVVTPPEQEAKIKLLVEQLVLADKPAGNSPTLNPNMKIYGADGKEVKTGGNSPDSENYRKRFNACQEAFKKLLDFKVAAFPLLISHLDDKRQSINFRNHFMANSVGDACLWCIYFQLQDQPENYSSYGLSRVGKDGKDHEKPYWDGTPFDEAGGVKKWLDQNKKLSYLEMQIHCVQWLLKKEKEIGACDAASYFENILPLEIRILERKLELGEDVGKELTKQRDIMARKDVGSIPADLLPTR
jgi:hypothetical protein